MILALMFTTDTNKPHLYLDTFGGKNYLIIAVTGRCDALYKIPIEADLSKSVPAVYLDNFVGYNNDIYSTTYDKTSSQLFFCF